MLCFCIREYITLLRNAIASDDITELVELIIAGPYPCEHPETCLIQNALDTDDDEPEPSGDENVGFLSAENDDDQPMQDQ